MSKNKKRSSNWKEQRRFHALELKRRGWKQVDIATALKVSKGAVSQWIQTANEQGKESLASRPHPGRPPELSQEEKRMIPDFLWHGAEAYGFRGDVWTCLRVRKVIDGSSAFRTTSRMLPVCSRI